MPIDPLAASHFVDFDFTTPMTGTFHTVSNIIGLFVLYNLFITWFSYVSKHILVNMIIY